MPPVLAQPSTLLQLPSWVPGTVLQAFAGTCIAFFFCCLQCRVCPYRERSDNLLKACAEAQLFFTLLISIILRTQLEREPVSSDDYGTILVVAFFSTPAVEVLLVMLKTCYSIFAEASNESNEKVRPSAQTALAH